MSNSKQRTVIRLLTDLATYVYNADDDGVRETLEQAKDAGVLGAVYDVVDVMHRDATEYRDDMDKEES